MSAGVLTVTLLGTGTSTGIPVVGCRCEVCTSEVPENRRTRCSALLSCGGRNILIDTSTDLRQQALREGIEHLDAVLFTHDHADHLHGIDDLRPFNGPHRGPIPIFGARQTIDRIRSAFDYIFSEELEPGYRPRLELREIGEALSLFGLTVEPIPLEHGTGASLGYRIGPFAYLTDCSAIPADSVRRLDGVHTLVIDGLRFTPHRTHFNIPQAITAARSVGAKRILLTHLSHEVEHVRHSRGLPQGVEFAYDGQRLEIELQSDKSQAF